jgi:hypothetical protein
MKLGNAPLASEPQGGLAELALAQGDEIWAQTLVETLLPMLAEHPRACVNSPFYAYLVCYRVLEANHDRRSITVLQTAQQRLQECASHIRMMRCAGRSWRTWRRTVRFSRRPRQRIARRRQLGYCENHRRRECDQGALRLYVIPSAILIYYSP